jgi:hypothetical protein
LTGSIPQSASAAENYLQSTAAIGSDDADIRYFPTESGAAIKVLSIPTSVYGQQISKKSFILSSSLYYIVDDANGNIIDQANGNARVGNIIYGQGIVIITNPNYQDIFPTAPKAVNDTAVFFTTDSPKTIDILANDIAGTCPIDTGSVILSGSNSSFYIVNSNGTITLNTSTAGSYDVYYNVYSNCGNGTCPIISNQALVTATVVPAPTTTSTTTSTTTEPTTTSTTTSTTTEPTTTTTTSTTTSTTTEPTTTTTTSTTTSTTTEPTTTTTTSTTTSTSTQPPTTSTTTTTTTTAPIPVNVTIQYDGTVWELYISQDFGAPPTLDALTFDGTVSGFTLAACAGSSTVGPIVFSKMLPAGNTSAFTEIVASPPADWQTAKVTTMQVNGEVINSNFQNIVVNGHTYEIRGFLVCFPL